MSLADILEAKGTAVHSIAPAAPVLAAVSEMHRNRVGALLVLEQQRPVGIVSERDVMTKVVLKGRDPLLTLVSTVMSQDVVCVSIETTPEEAMALMTERRFRHLPITADGAVIGIVSIGDLVRWVLKNQDFELRALREYVSGAYPCSAPASAGGHG